VRASSRRVLVVVAAGIAVFAGISVYADVSEIAARLRGFAWWTFAAAIGLALVNYALRFARWSIYLRDRGLAVAPRLSLLVFIAGFALSITPGKVGELLKSFLLRASLDIPIARSAPVVVAERVTDLLAVVLLALVGAALYGIGLATAIAGGVVVLGGLVVLSWPPLAAALINLATRPRRLSRFRVRLHALHRELAQLIRPWPLAWATAIGAVAWLAECVGFALIVNGFPGADVPLGLAILIYAVTTLAGALSFLPGGLLVTEAGMTLFLVRSARGVERATAGAATILTRLATLWFAVALGLVALALYRRLAPVGAAEALDRDLGSPPADDDRQSLQ
jgi:glycosyltransferase 2 family protein